MNVHLILFCIFCQYLISRQSHAMHSDSGEEPNSFEDRHVADLSAIGLTSSKKTNEDSEENQEENDKEDCKDENGNNEERNEDNEKQAEDNKNQYDNDFSDDSVKTKKLQEYTTEYPAQYKYEVNAGDMADLFANNKHMYVPHKYKDFGRRFVMKYPIKKKHSQVDNEAEARLDQAIKKFLQNNDVGDYLIPQKGPPELVLAVAKKSALLEARKPRDPSDELMKRDGLRTGDFWNGVWKEDVVVPKKVLRTKNKSLEDVLPDLETVRVKIMPGSKLHDLVSVATRISPRLLYIINNKQK